MFIFFLIFLQSWMLMNCLNNSIRRGYCTLVGCVRIRQNVLWERLDQHGWLFVDRFDIRVNHLQIVQFKNWLCFFLAFLWLDCLLRFQSFQSLRCSVKSCDFVTGRYKENRLFLSNLAFEDINNSCFSDVSQINLILNQELFRFCTQILNQIPFRANFKQTCVFLGHQTGSLS